ncbi:hypothetical protein LTR87_015393 [Friedmanniomyces endolithicus]|nr:hypothetical protein LTR87_015393 [Friedmanniomyces endolithicus]
MSGTPKQRSGSCLCGKVRYSISDKHGPDMTQLMCHCPNCLKSLGNSGAFTFCPIDNFTFTEGSKDRVKVYRDQATDSKDEMQRQFCTNCGSCVLITTDHNTTVAIVPVGTMDCGGQGWWKPEIECQCNNKKDWMAKYAGTQMHDRNPTFG